MVFDATVVVQECGTGAFGDVTKVRDVMRPPSNIKHGHTIEPGTWRSCEYPVLTAALHRVFDNLQFPAEGGILVLSA